jgi:hypothetical protein
MEWVIRKLKSILKTEKFIGRRHTPLKGDPKYAASAKFSKDRVPQLEQAIKILEDFKPVRAPEPKVKKRAKQIFSDQLNLFNDKSFNN